MKKLYAIVALLIACFAGLTAKANFNKTIADGLWDDPTIWSQGVVPTTIGPSDTVKIGTEVVLMTSLGVTNHGLVIVAAGHIQLVSTPSGGTKIRNRGKIRIVNGGKVSIMPVTTGTDNDVHNEPSGEIDITDGTLTNSGVVRNEETIRIQSNGVFRNYGTIDGFDGMPTIICGEIINSGEFVNNGTFDDGTCAGLATWFGNPMQTAPACEAPGGMTATGAVATGVTLDWNHVSGAMYYIVGIREDAGSTFHTRLVSAPLSSVSFGPAPAGVTSFEWGVLTVCEAGVIDISNGTISDAGTMARLAENTQLVTNPMQLDIYPNPVSDQLNITMDREIDGATINLFTINGQVIETLNIDKASAGDVVSLNVSKLPQGMYFVRVNEGNAIYQENVMIGR